MSQKSIAQYNPALFFEDVAKAIGEGFYADDSVQGYPALEGVQGLMTVTLSEGDKPIQRSNLVDKTEVEVLGYCNSTFLLDVQDAILQGFSVDPESISIANAGLHTLKLTKAAKAAPVKAEEKFTKPVKTPKPTKGAAVE